MKHNSANRLMAETSPYLLQHAHNPVDWFPWSEEALQLAKKRDCPILLSIGYSSCHWCHVMERESFEDSRTAALMNEHFVNIKVDREERPDLDAIYMNYVQLATGQGGWPLTVFLTPDLIPFFGGTYFPPESAHGRPGFKELLANINHFYRTQSEKITEKKEEILASLASTGEAQFGKEAVSEKTLGLAAGNSLRQFDSSYGGFGHAPKFPSSMIMAFLLRWHQRTGNSSALNAVELSLDSMARGGIYDQLGGGFHRYSVDERWLVPHFEKMLYDNALLVRLYLEAYQIHPRESYRQVVEETLGYVRRDLTHLSGGFYSAEDADSEGEEGRFYTWSVEETEAVLGKQDAKLFNDYYDVTAAGNWEGKNILNQRRELEGYAKELNLTIEELQYRLGSLQETLLEARSKRVRPLLDDKVIASWNGLMLTAFAEAAAVLNRDDFLDIARRNADFILTQMLANGRLCRTWKDERPRFPGYLDDYAHVIQGLISLFEVEGEIQWLEGAAALMRTQLELYFDKSSDDFFFTSTEHEDLPVRHKEFFDNAIPSGNSVSAQNLLRLAVLTGKRDYQSIAERMLEKMSQGMQQYSLAFGNWLQAADFYLGPRQEIVLVGPKEARKRLMGPIRETFLPRKLVVQTDGSVNYMSEKLPLLANRHMVNSQATAYLCEDMACQEPTTSVKRFREQLQGTQPSS